MPDTINPTSIPVFENTTITGDYVDGLTIAIDDTDANYSRTFGYNYVKKSTGLIGLLVDCTNGNASDTLAVTLEFNYGTTGDNSWTTKTIALAASQACNTSVYYRIDTNSSWRDCIPFDKIRFKFQKTNENALVTIKSKLVIA